jgi:Zn/Cd-binding protein ZinT
MTLYFVLKGEWFDKIESGEKTHEYRQAKQYWAKRITKVLIWKLKHKEDLTIEFRRGYKKDAPKLEAIISKVTFRLNGKETDLKYDGAVYDIEFRNVRRIA